MTAGDHQGRARFTLGGRENGLSAIVWFEPRILSVLCGIGAEMLLKGNFQVAFQEVIVAVKADTVLAFSVSHCKWVCADGWTRTLSCQGT